APHGTAIAAAAGAASGLLIARDGGESQTVRAVMLFLERLGLQSSVIDTSDTDSAPVVEQLERHPNAGYVLVFPDTSDEQLVADGDARLLLELGCCVGRLGAARVCELGRDELPPPVAGIARGVRHLVLADAGVWQLPVARQSKGGGVPSGLNRLVCSVRRGGVAGAGLVPAIQRNPQRADLRIHAERPRVAQELEDLDLQIGAGQLERV